MLYIKMNQLFESGKSSRVLKKKPTGGWLEGDLNRRRKMFSDNIVKEIKKKTEFKMTICPSKGKGMGM